MAKYDSDGETSLARPSIKSNSKADIRRNINPKYRVDELNEPSPRLPGIRALLPLPGGDLLTGGTDLKIRRWDHYRFAIILKFVHMIIQQSCVTLFFHAAVLTEVTAYVGHL